MSAVQVRLLAFWEKPYPDSDSGLLLNPYILLSYSDITHNLVLA
ncbi:hypothetical protein [Limnospira platensis]|nr:hypothetical protein [Arthrospira platensis PCC 7345]